MLGTTLLIDTCCVYLIAMNYQLNHDQPMYVWPVDTPIYKSNGGLIQRLPHKVPQSESKEYSLDGWYDNSDLILMIECSRKCCLSVIRYS